MSGAFSRPNLVFWSRKGKVKEIKPSRSHIFVRRVFSTVQHFGEHAGVVTYLGEGARPALRISYHLSMSVLGRVAGRASDAPVDARACLPRGPLTTKCRRNHSGRLGRGGAEVPKKSCRHSSARHPSVKIRRTDPDLPIFGRGRTRRASEKRIGELPCPSWLHAASKLILLTTCNP